MQFQEIKYFLVLCLLVPVCMAGQQKALIRIDASHEEAKVPSTLHGIFFEEISHAGEGGLYAELIRNRGFEECRIPQGTALQDGFIVPVRTPHFMLPGDKAGDWKMEWPLDKDAYPAWSLKTSNASASCFLTVEEPLNEATPHSMQVNINGVGKEGKADLINEGFWGINAVAGDEYDLSFYMHTDLSYKGDIIASLQSEDGRVLSSFRFKKIQSAGWKKLEATLKPSLSDPKAKFVLTFTAPGKVWVDFVSLFPAKTFKNRRNGLRKDLAELIQDLKPSFIRWPGGCFAEGITIYSAPDWKRTIGPVEQRPGTFSPWGYWTSDGFGYHEYLQFCEDIHADALYVFNAGVSCEYRSGTFAPDDSLHFYIQNALDAIEYAIGPVSSKWGKVRAANGHPAPFPLKYVEVGNEQHGPRYAERYNLFYDAIKKKYPQIIIMASMGIGDVNRNTTEKMRKIDYVDEHAYKPAYWAMNHFDHFDKYKRGDWDMYVGEYATNAGVGQGNMIAALSDAVYIMSMEKNGDLVKMSSYAPLLVNENDVDWPVNLIHFDASRSFARISYYVIKMMNENRASINLSTSVQVFPPAVKKNHFSGGIGLATWDTQSEYRDVEVTSNGQVVYKSNFINKPEEWSLLRGSWKVTGDAGLAQTAEGIQLLALLKNKTFDTYTLKMQARKLGGYNAFIIPFAVKDSNTFMRSHIGSWYNSNSVYEKVTNGYEVADMSVQKKLPLTIMPHTWYRLTLEVGQDTVKTFLNDTLLSVYTGPQTFFSIAGKDQATGDIIIKVVNAGDSPVEAVIQVDGAPYIRHEGLVSALRSESGTEENSFNQPGKFTPVTAAFQQAGAVFEKSFPAYSFSVIRLKTK